jgi:hypothetical protein
MTSPRWLARLAVPVMAGAALFGSTAVASADPQDDAYLAQLRGMGFTWAPEHDEGMISLAHHICFDRWFVKMSPDRIARDVHAVIGPQGLSFGDVTNMVNAAEATYCPTEPPGI